ncbi:hypothetical protein Pan44_27050 [Caulifigura coniformis]|uniref:KTSC domain-containing protein n=1 Tax=Caulifigura coniformis TaxID=2527983 RepID=A0A517SF08_9PLAN|nr:hypothetical protein Pan44_27050 [Caulifigura coniformis]
MDRYGNRGGDSGVVAYELGDGAIAVRFADGGVYLYTVASAGASNIRKMHQLAVAGYGLNTFISQNVKDRYAKKL